MSRRVDYVSGCPVFKYFLFHPLKPGEFKEVDEDFFYSWVKPFLQVTPGFETVKIYWDKEDRRRQNYIYKGSIIGYRLR